MLASAAPIALFDDNLGCGGDLLLSELVHRIECRSPADLPAAFAAIAAAQARGEWVALAAHYELGYALEPRLAPLLPVGDAPLLTAWVFGRVRRLSASETANEIARAIGTLDEHARLAGVAAVEPGIGQADHHAAVERIRGLIDAGDCYQVNFTFPLRGETWGDPLALYARLRDAQPVRYGAFVRDGDHAILSRSPELFVERRGDTLTCRPMKGTAPRRTDPATLAASEKDRAENVMIVDLIRDLGRLAPPGGVRVENLCEVEAYPSVWQMTSTVRGQPIRAGLADVFRALFPCGSITGAPKVRAMEIIRELETGPRGLYCGALGWLSPDGDFRFSVPIRTLEVGPDRAFRLGVGSGIVADSDPTAEWAECLVKGRFLTGLAPQFGLIETLRCEPAEASPYPLLALHLARLGRSAAHFGFAFDPVRVTDALLRAAAALDATHRVRLQLEPSGAIGLRTAPLAPLETTPCPTVVVSPLHVSSRDPLLRHKTTARSTYDAELERVAAEGHFDALFFNEHDELAEGARSTVFLAGDDGLLRTPPLDCGVLDGVFRRKLLDEGRARECRISRPELLAARALYVANALRGLVRVELRAPAQACSGPV